MADQVTDPWEEAAKAFKPSGAAPASAPATAPTSAPVNDDWKIWQAEQPNAPSPTPNRDAFANMAAGAGQALSNAPHAVMGALHDIFASPDIKRDPDTGKLTGLPPGYQPDADVLAKADEAEKAGNHGQAVVRRVLAHIPVVGSTLDTLGYGNREDMDKLIGSAGMNLLLGEGLGLTTRLGSEAYQASKGLTEADVPTALNKAYNPPGSKEDFTEKAPIAASDIKTYGGTPITGNESVIQAAQKTIENHQAALEEWMDHSRQLGVKVPGDPIVDATKSAISSAMRREEPEAVQSIIDRAAKAYGGQALDVDELRQLLKEKNAELDSFFDKKTGKQQASITSSSPQAVVKAQRDAIADALYKAMDPENNGEGPRSIQQRTGNVIDLLDSANTRRNAILKEKPVSTAGGIATGVAKLIDIPGKMIHGDLETGITNALHPMTGPTDALIKRAFDAAPSADPLPRPSPLTYNSRQLGAPPIVTPPPADTSGISVTTGPPITGPANRALPPPTIKASGVDFTSQPSGIKVTTGEPLRAPTSRQLPAAGTSDLPHTADETPAGGPRESVPVYGKDGKVSYYITQPRYASGDLVRLRNGQTVRISRINSDDGSFEY